MRLKKTCCTKVSVANTLSNIASVTAWFAPYSNNRTHYVRNQIDWVGGSVQSASGFGSETNPVLSVPRWRAAARAMTLIYCTHVYYDDDTQIYGSWRPSEADLRVCVVSQWMTSAQSCQDWSLKVLWCAICSTSASDSNWSGTYRQHNGAACDCRSRPCSNEYTWMLTSQWL